MLSRDRGANPVRTVLVLKTLEGLPLPARVLDVFFETGDWLGPRAKVDGNAFPESSWWWRLGSRFSGQPDRCGPCQPGRQAVSSPPSCRPSKGCDSDREVGRTARPGARLARGQGRTGRQSGEHRRCSPPGTGQGNEVPPGCASLPSGPKEDRDGVPGSGTCF